MNSSNLKSEPESQTSIPAPTLPETSPLSPLPIPGVEANPNDWSDDDDLIQVHGRKFGRYDEPSFERMRR